MLFLRDFTQPRPPIESLAGQRRVPPVRSPPSLPHRITKMSTATISKPLFDRINDALTTNPYVPSRLLHVETNEGRVVLKGNVRSFFQKQMAQEAILRVDGVETIDNLLEVNWV